MIFYFFLFLNFFPKSFNLFQIMLTRVRYEVANGLGRIKVDRFDQGCLRVEAQLIHNSFLKQVTQPQQASTR